jgi:hypothetical protein
VQAAAAKLRGGSEGLKVGPPVNGGDGQGV